MKAGSTRSDPSRARTPFENVLVWGSAVDAPILLQFAQPVLEADETSVRMMELPEPVGASGEAVIREAAAGEHDLVITGVWRAPHGRRALERRHLALIRRCPCPVWALECNEPRPVRRVLAALGPGLDDDVQTGRAARVASTAAAVAAAAGAEMEVLHSWTAYGANLLRPRMPIDDVAAYVAHARETARARLTHALSRAGLAPAAGAVHFVKGDFQPVLSRVVRDRDIDLVVMGTRGRRGWLDSVIRPRAESVLTTLRPSVLVVK